MDIPFDDYRELFEKFNHHGVEYLVVGAYAFGHHVRPRATEDIDLWVRPSKDNGKRIVAALEGMDVRRTVLEEALFWHPGPFFRVSEPPFQIDLMTDVPGLSWEQAWERKSKGSYADQNVWFISREDLIQAKQFAGRPQDLADLDLLLDAEA